VPVTDDDTFIVFDAVDARRELDRTARIRSSTRTAENLSSGCNS